MKDKIIFSWITLTTHYQEMGNLTSTESNKINSYFRQKLDLEGWTVLPYDSKQSLFQISADFTHAYKCDHCGKFSEDTNKYIVQLRPFNEEHSDEQLFALRVPTFIRQEDNLQRSKYGYILLPIDEIPNFIEEELTELLNN